MKRIFLLILVINSLAFTQAPPKREFRAAWVATVSRLDFPRSNWSTAAMQSEIIQMVDSLYNNGFNAIIFQVRPECDAFYASAYEPWSRFLTGTSGQAPSPYFDPLESWITAAHAHNMELHAWFNPYRVTTSSNPASLHPSHVYHQHPEWLLYTVNRGADTQEGMYSNTLETDRDLRESLILDPGKTAVQEYVINVFMDVVNNYDVDAVHMDDYFYPYGGMNGEDAGTFAAEPRGFTDIEYWRRDNINRLVQGIHDSIQVVKPWVKYGVSPFGIWKSGFPAGIVGTSSYYELYCDPMAWLGTGSIDYLTPQLYWAHGGGQDYAALMPWWADSVSAHGRHLYPGHAPYRISDYHNWPAAELPRQIRLNRVTEGCQGSVFFRLRNGVLDNPKGFLDSLDNVLYQYPALIPSMPWKDDVPPNAPLGAATVVGDGVILQWNPPAVASDGDLAHRFVIYRSDTTPIDILDPANILALVPGDSGSFVDPHGAGSYYAITSLDRLNNESTATQIIPDATISETLPGQRLLLSNFPNPFNPSTTIRIDLPNAAMLQVDIFDLKGKLVTELRSGLASAGVHELQWDGTDATGNAINTGVYFCRLQLKGNGLQGGDLQGQTLKMVYLK